MNHVAHLTTWHPWIDGVAGAFVLEQCQALEAVGLQVGLVFSRIEGLRAWRPSRMRRGLPGLVTTEDPVRSVGFKSWSLPGMRRFAPAINKAALANRLDAYCRSFGTPEVVHAHVALETGPSAMEFEVRTGTPFVLTEHSTEVLNGLSDERTEIARQVYNAARTVIAVSPVLAERIEAIAPEASIKVIPNLVRAHVFDLRQRRRRADGYLRIASIGVLAPHKRIGLALEAIRGLPRELRRRLEYTVIGDGPELKALQRRASSLDAAVDFVGNKPHREAMSILSSADLFLHPSSYETFGVVIAEAMALGLPVIATRCGGPEGFVTPDCGALVKVDDVSGMTEVLRDMLTKIEYWKNRSEEISAYARANFHESAVACAIEKTYRF